MFPTHRRFNIELRLEQAFECFHWTRLMLYRPEAYGPGALTLGSAVPRDDGQGDDEILRLKRLQAE